MNLIEVDIHNLSIIDWLSEVHYSAYKEKFSSGISNNKTDYLLSTLDDVEYRKVFIDSELRGLIVLEDRTDRLLHNSTYYLVTRIYVLPAYRGIGVAKGMIKQCQNALGVLMGYSGKFYKIKDNL